MLWDRLQLVFQIVQCYFIRCGGRSLLLLLLNNKKSRMGGRFKYFEAYFWERNVVSFARQAPRQYFGKHWPGRKKVWKESDKSHSFSYTNPNKLRSQNCSSSCAFWTHCKEPEPSTKLSGTFGIPWIKPASPTGQKGKGQQMVPSKPTNCDNTDQSRSLSGVI